MKLTARFILLVLAMLVAVGICERQGALALDRLDAALQGVVHSDMERMLAITHVRRLFRSMVVLEGDYLLAKSHSDRAAMDKKMISLAKEQLEQIDKYSTLAPSDDAQALRDIRAVRERWIERDKRVRELAPSSPAEALAVAKTHSQDPVNWEKVIGSLVKLNEKRLADQVAATKVTYLSAKRTLTIVAAMAVIVAAGLGLMIFRGIRRAVNEVISLNTNLESLVASRTQALAERERSLRLVLDSTGDAFIELERSGMLGGECSATARRWFGEPTATTSGASYLFPEDLKGRARFEAAFSQVADDVLPWDLTAEQMPKRIEIGELILDLEYKQIQKDGLFDRVLVVAHDVTASVQSHLAEKNVREQQALIAKLLSDKAGFAQFVKESESILGQLTTETSLAQFKRLLHTLKGNTAIFGLASISDFCHSIEDKIAASDSLPDAVEIADLSSLWSKKLQSIETFLSTLGSNVLEVESAEHQQLIDSLLARRDYREIVSMVEMWSWYRTSERLARLRAQTEYVARRLERDVNVVVEHNDIRVPKEYLDRFWPALVHVVRNSVDHGAEADSIRVAQGKSPRATITLRTYNRGDELVVEVGDDGPGITREALLRSAKRLGIAVAADATVEQLALMDGISSRQQVSDVSGRGIGLSAVRQACETEGGALHIINVPGKGVTFQFCFRRPVVKPGALAVKLEKRWSLIPHSNVKVVIPESQTVRLGPEIKTSEG